MSNDASGRLFKGSGHYFTYFGVQVMVIFWQVFRLLVWAYALGLRV